MKTRKEVKCIIDELPDKRIGMSKEDHAYCPKCHPKPTPETSHTPTPWELGADGRGIMADNQKLILHVKNTGPEHAGKPGHVSVRESLANAAFIVRAVNSHDELLEAAKNARNVLAALAVGDLKQVRADSSALLALRSAIAKAEGK